MTNKIADEAREEGMKKAGSRGPAVAAKYMYNNPLADLLIPTHEYPMELSNAVDGEGEPTATPWTVLLVAQGNHSEYIAGYINAEPDELEYALLIPVEIAGGVDWVEAYYGRQFVVCAWTLADADRQAVSVKAPNE